jgi:hypothetical protein
VNLTDRIPWQWYLVAAAVPVGGQLVAAVAGIVFMARSKIGPALALWATCFLASGLWTGIGVLVSIAGVGSESASSSFVIPQDSSDAIPGPESEPSAGSADEPTAGADLKSCGNLRVDADATCPFAQNVFWEYWNALENVGSAEAISAYSDALGEWLEVTCEDGGTIVCTTDSGSEVRISQAALGGYTQAMADEYAESHTVGAR